ncbi:MAG: hypothetical protein CM1200mP36_00400 [Gammaproteobacteria bacterium]|nr:MAG: hypothetical protein CM1200mP36_00400 [Gammaproteobacteria bacterium]
MHRVSLIDGLRRRDARSFWGETSWRTGIDRDALLNLSHGSHALRGATIKRSPIERTFLEQLPELRIIAKYTIGVEDVDLGAATDRGGPCDSQSDGSELGRCR